MSIRTMQAKKEGKGEGKGERGTDCERCEVGARDILSVEVLKRIERKEERKGEGGTATSKKLR